MSDVATKNSLRKLRDKMRFDWHEKLTLTEVELPGTVARYANWIMHDREFKISDLGYVELSMRNPAKELRISKRAAQRANHCWCHMNGWCRSQDMGMRRSAFVSVAGTVFGRC